MIKKFHPDKFLADYNKWRSLKFLTYDTDEEEIYDLRYDLNTNLAGIWITLVESDFKDINPKVDDKQIHLLLDRAKKIKSRINENVNKNDTLLVDNYIEYIEQHLSMYMNYKMAI